MAATPQKKRRLGKGLGGLMKKAVEVAPPEDRNTDEGLPAIPTSSEVIKKKAGKRADPKRTVSGTSVSDGDGLLYLAPAQISPNPRQPRQVFDEDALSALADSIKRAGLMQPIVVRGTTTPDQYELVAGERRWRAAQLAGIATLPSIVREIDDKTSAEWALIENLQREDLNPIDRAEAFDRLVVDFDATQKEIAEQLGVNRSSVANFLRLNDLGDFAKDAVRDGRLSMGHAKVILGIPDVTKSNAISRRCAKEQWSVRELERQVKVRSAAKDSVATEQDPLEMFMDNLSGQLEEHLGTQVSIHVGKKKGTGKMSISFYSNEQFEGILHRFGFTPKS